MIPLKLKRAIRSFTSKLKELFTEKTGEEFFFTIEDDSEDNKELDSIRITVEPIVTPYYAGIQLDISHPSLPPSASVYLDFYDNKVRVHCYLKDKELEPDPNLPYLYEEEASEVITLIEDARKDAKDTMRLLYP